MSTLSSETSARKQQHTAFLGRYSPANLHPLRWGRWTARAILPALVLVAALVLIWQWYASQPNIDPQLLPTPLAVWSALVAERALLWHHMLVTLWETVVGFGPA